jgi:hypothetical protein
MNDRPPTQSALTPIRRGPPAHSTDSAVPGKTASLMVRGFMLLNRFVRWDRLPTLLGALNLHAYRMLQRETNLYDTNTIPTTTTTELPPRTPARLQYRTSDGSYNDLDHPTMGMAGTRFGRNVPLDRVYPDPMPALITPSPRTVSLRLMTRERFQPATTLNLLAAAWIQFQTHDWFNHGQPQRDKTIDIPLARDDTWHENPMRIPRTNPDPTRVPGAEDGPPTFINPASHWWDASGVYGSSEANTKQLRCGEIGKLTVSERRLPIDPVTGISLTGFNDNWWLGLGLLHTLFALEHNAICESLHLQYPHWTDDQLFETARLINSALMAKIHTVEWTPGILAHPTLQLGMRANWWGLAEERVSRLIGRLSKSEAISGIPGSPLNHHSAPYALTEEFASVYRLHPLLPDELEIRSLDTGNVLKQFTFPELLGKRSESVIGGSIDTLDVLYSFGTTHPGAITLHNYPRFMQDLTLDNGRRLDLAATDIMRDRERGVPRYNEFRRLIHLSPATSFDTLTDNPTWARELREVYENDLERVDLMAGMYAETPPKGFGFSDTAFRIFVLMASRRLKSDRFFTTDYNPKVYTQLGMRWIDDNTMISVLLRHYPELTPALRGVENAFAPWQRIW